MRNDEVIFAPLSTLIQWQSRALHTRPQLPLYHLFTQFGVIISSLCYRCMALLRSVLVDSRRIFIRFCLNHCRVCFELCHFRAYKNICCLL